MISFFLRAKHWLVFILTSGIPMIVQMFIFIGMMGQMMGMFYAESEPDPDQFLKIYQFMKFFPLIILIGSAGFFLWMWSLGIGLQHKIPASVRLNTGWFKLAMILPIVYIFLLATFIMSIFRELNLGTQGELPFNPTYMMFIIPLHLLTMLCMFYAMYFSAKSLKTAELQKEAGISEFALEFVLIWFYIIGVWFIQPRVNAIMERSGESSTDIS
ncbi:MAG: hypothetical protein OER04_10340 [Cyclobacteriaceae bacterium]|nr:hypothetical protein [Cyclobacteriaceae bacterium]